MSEAACEFDGGLGIVTLHFKVEEHYLPLRQFIDTATSAEGVIGAFDKTVFNGALKFQVLVLPPEAGTFKTRLGVVILAVGTAVWGALESDIGKSFVKGATGNEPAHYAEQAGLKIREMISSKKSDVRDAEEIRTPDPKEDAVICKILADCTKGFLEKDYNNLRAQGVRADIFREAYQARNAFYASCYDNPDILAIGFDDSQNFPINRRDFPAYIIDVPHLVDEAAEVDWSVEVRYVQVTSPNWDRGDRHRQWKAKVSKDKAVTFVVDDDSFWKMVNDKKIPTQVRDNMKVQWAFFSEGGKMKGTKVLRVLEINGKKLSDPLEDEELARALLRYVPVVQEEKDLFG